MSRKQKLGHLLEGKSLSLETVRKLSQGSVFALQSRYKDRVQVYGSMNTLVHLGRVIQEIETSGEYKILLDEIQDIDIVILETNIDVSNLRLRIGYWVDKYKAKGWTFYKDIAPLRYTLETLLEHKQGRLCYCLYLRNQGNDRKLIGIFDKKSELTKWKKDTYKGERVSAIVYHESVLDRS